MKVLLAILAVGLCLLTASCQPAKSQRVLAPTYADLGYQAITHLLADFSTAGKWKGCTSGCGAANQDWGDDSLTYTLYLRWKSHAHDSSVVPVLQALAETAPSYPRACQTPRTCQLWSDEPLWDSIALGREYEATGSQNPLFLTKEKAAFQAIDAAAPSVYGFGACPAIHYQHPDGATHLKTLETDSNYIKAALLLSRFTQNPSYLSKARTEYAAVRQTFLDAQRPLYTVYVFDNGKACTPVPGRFFASVNGNMIDNGLMLAQLTGDVTYRNEAIATARAVTTDLSDATGVFADLQAENDIVEPLIEAMDAVATTQQQDFARRWLLAAASASASSRKADGTYSRFFDGPPQMGTSTAWQSNGGFALAVSVAGIDPTGTPATTTAWAHARSMHASITTRTLPATFTFTGRGIALLGTLGEHCCETGHARVFIDGTESVDTTGIWQNKSSSGLRLPNTVLFAWQWPTAGKHTIQIKPGIFNVKEGGSFVDITSSLVLP